MPVVTAFQVRPRRVLALDAAVEVPVVDHGRARDAVAVDGERAVPGGGARPPAVFGALVDEAHAAAEVGGRVGAHGLEQVEAVVDVEPLDRRRADHLDGELDLVVGNAGDVAHDAAAASLGIGGPGCRIAQEHLGVAMPARAVTSSSARLPVVA